MPRGAEEEDFGGTCHPRARQHLYAPRGRVVCLHISCVLRTSLPRASLLALRQGCGLRAGSERVGVPVRPVPSAEAQPGRSPSPPVLCCTGSLVPQGRLGQNSATCTCSDPRSYGSPARRRLGWVRPAGPLVSLQPRGWRWPGPCSGRPGHGTKLYTSDDTTWAWS